jgi:hypothetical protein
MKCFPGCPGGLQRKLVGKTGYIFLEMWYIKDTL